VLAINASIQLYLCDKRDESIGWPFGR